MDQNVYSKPEMISSDKYLMFEWQNYLKRN